VAVVGVVVAAQAQVGVLPSSDGPLMRPSLSYTYCVTLAVFGAMVWRSSPFSRSAGELVLETEARLSEG
jgi:hypothetical protein